MNKENIGQKENAIYSYNDVMIFAVFHPLGIVYSERQIVFVCIDNDDDDCKIKFHCQLKGTMAERIKQILACRTN